MRIFVEHRDRSTRHVAERTVDQETRPVHQSSPPGVPPVGCPWTSVYDGGPIPVFRLHFPELQDSKPPLKFGPTSGPPLLVKSDAVV